MQLANNVSSLK